MGGKPRRKPVERPKFPPHCLHCEGDDCVWPKAEPRFCTMACAAEYACEHASDMRYCEKHGWWDRGWYGFPDESLGCFECYDERESRKENP